MRTRSGLILAAIALSLAACATPDATASPSSAPSATAPSSSTTATAAPSPTEPPSPTASPAAAVPLTVEWNAEDLKGIGTVDVIRGVTKAGDTYVLLASLPYEDGAPDSAVWWSSDGTAWTLAKTFPVADQHLLADGRRPRVRGRRNQ